MSNHLETLLAELRQDHRNMAILLNLLEREIEIVYAGTGPDLELIQNIMHYMTVYPDMVHHPKEDCVYLELKRVQPELSSRLAGVTVEHRKIAEQGLTLRDKVNGAVAGDMIERNAVVADAMRYIDSLRAHMRWEESDLFRCADEMIADGHTEVDLTNILGRADPLFGSTVEQRFESLFRSITQDD